MIGYLRAVPRADVDAVWPMAWPVIAPSVALWRGRYDEAALLLQVRTAEKQLWIAEEGGAVIAACLTSIHDYPCLKECNVAVFAGAGTSGRWPEWMAAIKEWAVSIGCKLVTAHCRKGFEPALKHLGFDLDCIVLSAEL